MMTLRISCIRVRKLMTASRAVFCGKFSFLARVIKILGPQLIDDFIV